MSLLAKCSKSLSPRDKKESDRTDSEDTAPDSSENEEDKDANYWKKLYLKTIEESSKQREKKKEGSSKNKKQKKKDKELKKPKNTEPAAKPLQVSKQFLNQTHLNISGGIKKKTQSNFGQIKLNIFILS